MAPIEIALWQVTLGTITLGLTIGGVIAAAVRRSARVQAAEVAREEVARHSGVCAWRAEKDHLASELRYIRERVDSIADYLRNGKRIGP